MKVAFRKNGKSLFSRVIRIWPFGGAAGRYSHSELVFSDGRTFSSDEADGGTRWTKRELLSDEWDFLAVPCSEGQEKELLAFCANEDGLKYDMRGIAFSFLPIPIGWQSAEKWFCSEICVAALQQIGYLTGYTPARISPNKLYKILKKECGPRIKALPIALLFFLTACGTVAVPKTVGLEAGTGVRHEVGESPVRNNTAAIKVMWELRK